MPIDPVCGGVVVPRLARKERRGGRRYFFCSEACRRRFSADPLAYTIDHP